MNTRVVLFGLLLAGTIVWWRAQSPTDEIAPVGELLEGRDALVMERRAEARAAYDRSQVPADLQDLIPLAIVWGSTDNYSDHASDAEKAELKRELDGRVEAIDRWLGTFDMELPLPLEASTFFWMRDEYEVVDM